MKKIILGVILLFTISSCGQGIRAKGPVITKDYQVNNFNGISVSDGLRLIVTMGDVEHAEVTAAESLQRYIEVFVRENTLHIGIKDNYWFKNVSANETPEIHVYAKSLKDLEGSGGARIVGTNKITGTDMDIEISGGGYCECDMEMTKIDTEVSGGGKIKLTGSAATFNIDASGGSRCECFELITNDTDIDVSGGGIAQVTVNGRLDVEAAGGSRVEYKGIGVLGKQELSGGSNITKVK